MNKLIKRVGAATAAFALVFALAGTTSAVTKWATPDDWYSSADDGQGVNSNGEAFWEDRFELDEGDCHKLTADELDAVMNEDGSADLGVAYDFVVVKQANPNAKDVTYDNTIFEDVAADETVFADTNGDGAYTAADSNGISHIIVCNPTEVPTTAPTFTNEPGGESDAPTLAPTFTNEPGGESDAPTLPNTSSIDGNGTSGPADGAWLLVVALGVLLASIVVLTPARAKSRR